MSAPAAPAELQAKIRTVYDQTQSTRETASVCGCSENTVRRYRNSTGTSQQLFYRDPAAPAAVAIPAAKHETPTPPAVVNAMPDPVSAKYEPFAIDTPGAWLILNDIHVPYHDRTTLELAVAEAKQRGVAGVILNGDTLDSHEVSNHDKDPTAPRYVEEVEMGRRLLLWLRSQLHKARLILKEGNHEERLGRYIVQRAPALFGLEGLDLPSLLHCQEVGAEWVGDKRVIALGKLCVVHGHEYRGGGGVSPARWLYLRAKYVSLCGHFHRSSEHGERTIRGTYERAWSVGCACYLHPRYMPINSWDHGFALVEVDNNGHFVVSNRRVFNGKVV